MMNSFWCGTNTSVGKGIHWHSWDKLCYRKEECGMGFRQLYSFNLALFVKLGWNLLSNPNSVTTCILKAKYFSNNSFLTAHVGDEFKTQLILSPFFMNIFRFNAQFKCQIIEYSSKFVFTGI